jgi:hypothetical protein
MNLCEVEVTLALLNWGPEIMYDNRYLKNVQFQLGNFL